MTQNRHLGRKNLGFRDGWIWGKNRSFSFGICNKTTFQ